MRVIRRTDSIETRLNAECFFERLQRFLPCQRKEMISVLAAHPKTCRRRTDGSEARYRSF